MSSQTTSPTQKVAPLSLRPFQDHEDLSAMRALLVTGRRSGAPTHYVHTGDLNWWLFYLNQIDDRRQTIYLWEQADLLLGWVLLSPRFQAFDVFIHPDIIQANGLTRDESFELYTWAEERLTELVLAHNNMPHNEAYSEASNQTTPTVSTMWVSEHDTQLLEHLRARGFQQAEYHIHYLERSLLDLPSTHKLAPGFQIRHIIGEEESARRATVSHRAFSSYEPLTTYIDRYRQFMRSPVYSPEWDLVAVAPNGRFGAFALCWLDPVNSTGYFEPIGSHPDFRRRGLARAVLSAGLRRMQAVGMQKAAVCVEWDNLAGQRLYDSMGFHKAYTIYTFEKIIEKTIGRDAT